MAKQANSDDRADALRELKADLKNGTFRNFYIFSGEEAYLREHYLSLLTQKLTGGPAGDFNYHRFSAETLTPEALADAVEAVPMMAERTLVRVDDVDFFKMNEHARGQYGSILSDLPDFCCLVLVYDTTEYKINRQMKQLAEIFAEKAFPVAFQKQSERDLVSWISRHFRACGRGISDELCRYMIFLTDGMMTNLGPEIEKTAAYASGQEITRADIDAVVIPVLNAQTFDISDAVAAGNYELALRKLEELFAMQEDCGMILGAIGAQLRRLLYAKTITAAGKGQETLMQLTGLRSYPAGLTMTAARRVSEAFCRRAAELCLETDRALKSGADEPERLLELLLAKLAGEARRD